MGDETYFDKYEKRILQVMIKERRALSVLEISKLTGISRQKITETLQELKKKDFAIEVIEDEEEEESQTQ